MTEPASKTSADYAILETDWFLAPDQEPERQIPIDRNPFRIGRSANLPLSLRSEHVSNEHAEIDEQNGKLWIRDLQSTNGTYVNGIKVSDAVALQEGDLIQFAAIAFRVDRASMEGGVKAWWKMIRYAISDDP